MSHITYDFSKTAEFLTTDTLLGDIESDVLGAMRMLLEYKFLVRKDILEILRTLIVCNDLITSIRYIRKEDEL